MAAVADVAVPFLKKFLRSSVAVFLLVSQTFAPCLITSCHFSLSCAWQSGAILKDFMETFSVSLKHFF